MARVNSFVFSFFIASLFVSTGIGFGQTKGTTEAFTIHHHNKHAVKVFDSPNGNVLAKIYPTREEMTGHIFSILECRDGWFRINMNLTNVDSWVKEGSLAINSRNYDQTTLAFYERSAEDSKVVCKINYEATLILMNIDNGWLKVALKRKKGGACIGWIRKEMACGNPYTTCN